MASSRVSTLELFFDLVFVFTVTQVALIVEDDPTWPRVAQAVLELAAIFWMYGGFAWLTNVLGTQTARQRFVILTGMAAFLVTSLALPRAFSDDAKVFGVAYGALTLVHLAGFLLRGSATFAAMLRVGAANLFGAALILIAGFVGGSARWPLWIAAVAILYLWSGRRRRPVVGVLRRRRRGSGRGFRRAAAPAARKPGARRLRPPSPRDDRRHSRHRRRLTALAA
jgi:low temperature requirement protein LtrA